MAGTAVVVGVGPGIGAASARRAAAEGLAVALVARSRERLDDLAGRIKADGGEARGFPADVADEASLTDALAQVQDGYGDPELLHYNASAYLGGPPSELDVEELVETFRVSVTGLLPAARAVLPAMRAAGRGSLLVTGGGLALHPNPAYAGLAVGKVAVRHLVLMLAQELRPEGIHVATVTVTGVVAPGTAFDPDLIAGEFWRQHTLPREEWQPEVVFDGR